MLSLAWSSCLILRSLEEGDLCNILYKCSSLLHKDLSLQIGERARIPFSYRFFGKQELGSSLARACSLLLSTFALTFFLELPQFARRENLFRRHDGIRPHLWQESANWQVFRLEEGSQENKSSPLCTTQTTNRRLRRSLFHALACDVLFRQLFWTGHW